MKIENLIIIGAGPAGLTAAIYAARANISPLVFPCLMFTLNILYIRFFTSFTNSFSFLLKLKPIPSLLFE